VSNRFLTRVLAALVSFVAGSDDDDTGATATEYALLVGFIAMVIIVGVTAFGSNLNDFYDRMTTTLSGVF
jgi:pilus assembly protein Flp/PilA